MSDETTTTVPDDVTTEAPAQEPDWKKFSRQWEERAKTANAELEALREKAKKLDELEEQQKTEAEKLAEKVAKAEARAAELEKSLAEKDRAVLVERVAAAKGVPARYLTGDTEDDLNKSADQFLEDIKPIAEARPAGIVPSAGTGDRKPSVSSVDDARARAAAMYAPKQ